MSRTHAPARPPWRGLAWFTVAMIASGLVVSHVVTAETPVAEESPVDRDARRGAYGVVDVPPNDLGIDLGVADQRRSPYFPSRATTNGLALTPAMFDTSEVCQGCHPAIYEEWRSSMMAHSWKDPVYRALLRLAREDNEHALDNFCIGCHSPVGMVTGEALLDEGQLSAASEQGVHCDVCHSISGITGIGNGAFVLTPRLHGNPLRFGPYEDAVSPAHDTAHSELHTRSEFCAACHNVTHPFNRVPIERTYDEWRDSPYNGRGIDCQDCHMPPAPGKASPLGQDRREVWSHTFVGGNVPVLEYFGEHDQAARSRALLATAARLTWRSLPPSLRAGSTANVSLQVTNSGAGHKLPTGFPEGREVWVDFTVTDATGREVYRSGAVRDGQTEPGTRSYRVVLGNARNEVVALRAWEADRILEDTRIAPLESALETFAFPVPKGARGPLRVRADLNYWPFSPALLEELGLEGEVAAPAIGMTSLEASIPLQ